jgi:hypothetical protein
MKYLKRFNESVNNIDGIIETIKDILLPLSDMGYDIGCNKGQQVLLKNREQFSGELFIRVVRHGDPTLKMNDEVKDEFIRMKDYLESEGFKSIVVHYIIKLRLGAIFPVNNRQMNVDFNEFIKIEDFEFSNLLFVAKV